MIGGLSNTVSFPNSGGTGRRGGAKKTKTNLKEDNEDGFVSSEKKDEESVKKHEPVKQVDAADEVMVVKETFVPKEEAEVEAAAEVEEIRVCPF